MYFLGLDTYEEGEMYINGEETSGYTEKDFENYRKKYIGNIFQNFNLVNSYTVYQNIELVLLINGYKKHKVKKQILKVIDEVGLTKYKNTKVSKLSGGQKQRVAIARALIKETPIIVADEPTGNLDSKTAQSIIELLHKVAKNKLVVVVTHNYEQIEKYATRKLVMHDGKIIEDKVLEKKDENTTIDNGENYISLSSIPKAQNKKKNIGFINKLRLGVRNTFNIKIKFLLLLLVFFFVTISVFAGYTSLKKQEYEQENTGYNNYFDNTSNKRILVKKKDNSEFTKKDYDKINKIENVDYIVENDVVLDGLLNVKVGNSTVYTNFNDIKAFSGTIKYGRMPEKENEVLMYGGYANIYIEDAKNLLLNLDCEINDGMEKIEKNLKIVGVVVNEEEMYGDMVCYANTKVLEKVKNAKMKNLSTITTEYNEKILSQIGKQYEVLPNKNVPEGYAIVPQDMNYLADYGYCIGDPIKITIENMYFTKELEVEIYTYYEEYDFEDLTGLTDYQNNKGAIFVNKDEYNNLFKEGNFQISVFVKDDRQADTTLTELEKAGFKTLYIKDTLQSYSGRNDPIVRLINVVIVCVVCIVLCFISYFIIKIILKSRNVYFSTIRILGATRKNAKQLLKIELFTVLNIAYLIVLLLIVLINVNVIDIPYLYSLVTFLELRDYVLAYIILVLISILIANTYSRKLFKKSAMDTYRDEEV